MYFFYDIIVYGSEKMKSLFISTYSQLITIGLLDNGKLFKVKENISDRTHSIHLIPLINEILKENNYQIKDINEIIVINGPGSFTGGRLGITVAKTLAYTLNIPIKTINTLDALAISNQDKKNKIISIEDAKGAYFATYINNQLEGELKYLNQNEFNDFLNNHQDYLHITNQKLDLELIYDYLKEHEYINPHQVNPVYIKTIEVQND